MQGVEAVTATIVRILCGDIKSNHIPNVMERTFPEFSVTMINWINSSNELVVNCRVSLKEESVSFEEIFTFSKPYGVLHGIVIELVEFVQPKMETKYQLQHMLLNYQKKLVEYWKKTGILKSNK